MIAGKYSYPSDTDKYIRGKGTTDLSKRKSMEELKIILFKNAVMLRQF